MNILYVENHAVFADNVIRKHLSRHTVTIVPNLAAARGAFLRSPHRVILIDCDLDDGKGDELIRELRAQGNRAIAIGVSSHEEGNAALLRAGASAVCSKMQFDQIQNVIDTLTAK